MVESPDGVVAEEAGLLRARRAGRRSPSTARLGGAEALRELLQTLGAQRVLFLVVEPSASWSALTASSSASVHLSSSQSVPVTVASACCAAVTTAGDAVAVDAAHRDDADVVAEQATAHRERLHVADHALRAGRCDR